MPGEEEYSDDYVAQLLAKDARTSAKNYSSFGLQAFLPKRSINNAPKPNTRFLKNIIKETDNHNAALKVKEEREARARLQGLGRSGAEKFSSPASKRTRHEEDGEHRPKRRKLDEINGILSSRSLVHQKSRADGRNETKSHRKREGEQYSDEELSGEDHKSRQRRRHRHRDSHRHRSDSEGESRYEKSRRHKRIRRRSRSHSLQSDPSEHSLHRSTRHARNRSHSQIDRKNTKNQSDHHAPSGTDNPLKAPQNNPKDDRNDEKNDDSDPLESLGLIGPAPPPQSPNIKSRGRGAFASTAASTIDHHFKSNYDPTVDVAPDAVEVEDDWDQALEALKDRRQWQQNQAERLRMAGFSEAEISKWEKGRNGAEGEVEDVKWSERGKGREWDRGKVVDGEGDVETGNVEWGRLKGT